MTTNDGATRQVEDEGSDKEGDAPKRGWDEGYEAGRIDERTRIFIANSGDATGTVGATQAGPDYVNPMSSPQYEAGWKVGYDVGRKDAERATPSPEPGTRLVSSEQGNWPPSPEPPAAPAGSERIVGVPADSPRPGKSHGASDASVDKATARVAPAWTVPCPVCEGRGELPEAVQAWDEGGPIPDCHHCHGTGELNLGELLLASYRESRPPAVDVAGETRRAELIKIGERIGEAYAQGWRDCRDGKHLNMSELSPMATLRDRAKELVEALDRFAPIGTAYPLGRQHALPYEMELAALRTALEEEK